MATETIVYPSLEAWIEDYAERQIRAAVIERARQCRGCGRRLTVDELVAQVACRGRREPCSCGYRAPVEPIRSETRFELGADGWPKAVR
jgi:hypothetical protein